MSQSAATEAADAGLGTWVVVESHSEQDRPSEDIECALENQTIYDGVIYEHGKIKGTLSRLPSKGNEGRSVKSSPRRFGWSTLSAKLKKIIKKLTPTSKKVEGEEFELSTFNN